MKIELDIKDFIKLCDDKDPNDFHNLNVDRYQVTKMIIKNILESDTNEIYLSISIAMNLYQNLSDLEFIENFKEDLKLLSIYDLGLIFNNLIRCRKLNSLEIILDTIGKKPSDYPIYEIENLLKEVDDEYLEKYISVENVKENISKADFKVCEKLVETAEKDLEDIVKEFITHSDETIFKNSLEILKLIVPTSSSMVHNSRARRLSYLEKFRDKLVYDSHLELFNEAFPELDEDYDHLISYKISTQNEADHISKMYKKYPNYRHD